MSTPEYTVGQSMLATDDTFRHLGPKNMVIRKVGREFLYASEPFHAPDDARFYRKFRIENRYEAVKYGSGGRIYTLDQWDEYEAIRERREILRGLGVAVTDFRNDTSFKNATSAQLQAIIDILDPVIVSEKEY